MNKAILEIELRGKSGSGKTLFAREIELAARARGYLVEVIDEKVDKATVRIYRGDSQ